MILQTRKHYVLRFNRSTLHSLLDFSYGVVSGVMAVMIVALQTGVLK